MHLRDAAIHTAAKVAYIVTPRLPEGVKRLMVAGRPVTVDGNTLDATMQLTFEADAALGIGRLVSSSHVPTAREALRAQARLVKPDPSVEVREFGLPGPAGLIGARLYRPACARPPRALLVYYHGGGFALGDLDTHDHLCRRICRDGELQVLSIDYRRPPEHKAPAAGEDAFAAYRWAVDNAAELGADDRLVAVGGDSAGGNLAAVVAQRARDDVVAQRARDDVVAQRARDDVVAQRARDDVVAQRARGTVRLPALQLLIYPVTDLSRATRSTALFSDGYHLTVRDMDWFADLYLSGSDVDTTDPRVSPLLAADLSGLPPALVVTAGFDPLRDEGNAYADAMRAAGVSVDLRQEHSLGHSFATFFPLGGRGSAAVAEVISALRAHLRRIGEC